MKTDTFFFKLLEAQPSLLLRLARLDALAGAPYRFQSVELKETALRSDGVLFPEAGAPDDAPIIVCEVQFWADKLIYTRLVAETARLHLQMPEARAFQMVLVLRSREIDADAGAWKALLSDGTLRVVFLDEAVKAFVPEDAAAPVSGVSPEEQTALLLIQFTVSPSDRAADDNRIPTLANGIAQTQNLALQAMFRDLFVSLYISKYKELSIEVVRAMINTTEIFDDIHESRAVQEYGREIAEKSKREGKIENAVAMARFGVPIETIAAALDLSVEAIVNALNNPNYD